MIDKERLEGIRGTEVEKLGGTIEDYSLVCALNDLIAQGVVGFISTQNIVRDVKWLILQAERVQELERENALLEGEKGIKSALNDKTVEIIKRYREAIENTQVAIQKNLSKWNYKDEVVLHDVFIKNKKLLEELK